MDQGIDLMPVILPQETETDGDLSPSLAPPDLEHPYIVILYNDEVHSFPDVEHQLQKATGCTLEKAEALSHEVHSKGRAIVFSGSSVECNRVANVLREIRLQVETDRA